MRDLHNQLPQRPHKLIGHAEQKKTKYAVIDCYNRYLVGWVGCCGNWGKFDDMVLFDTIKQAKSQIAFMVLDRSLSPRILKMVRQVSMTVVQDLGPLQMSEKERERLVQEQYR